MIERLVVHRFRGIKSASIDKFKKINILLGPNNSGKSAIMEMLYLASVSGRDCSFFSESLDMPAFNDNKGISVSNEMPAQTPIDFDFLGLKPWPRLWKRHGQVPYWKDNPSNITEQNSLLYHLTYLKKDHPLKIFKLIPPPIEDVEYFGGFKPEDIQTVASFTTVNGHPTPSILPEFIKDNLTADILNSSLTYAWYPPFVFSEHIKAPIDSFEKIAVWNIEGHKPHHEHVLFFDFHTAHDHFNPSFYKKAWESIPDWYENIADAISKVYPELKSCRIEIVPHDMNLEDSKMRGFIRLPNTLPIPVDNFGDGTRHAFKVLSGLIALRELTSENQSGIFLWEDPEMFMHPEAMRKLLEIIMEIVSTSNIQMFACTQSLEVIATLGKMMEEQNSGIEDMLCTFSLMLTKNNQLEYRYFDGDQINIWMESGFDPRHGFSNIQHEYPLNWELKREPSDEYEEDGL